LLALDEQVFWTLTNDSHAFAVNMLLKLVQRLRANNAAVSENVKQRRQFERAAMFDGLTGIHNRRWLDDTLNRLVDRNNPDGERRAARIHAPSALSLALLDIDHFKRFNDTYGHAAGDQVLTAVARTLTDNLRPTDLVARFGGEEFVIIFPDTDIGQAVIAAERVRLSIAATEVCTLNGQPLPRVTVSIGIAQLAPGQSVKDFLEVADQALYRAKDAGRNRVVH
jgi:diguanylate cyclase (GGDEF)-like protein